MKDQSNKIILLYFLFLLFANKGYSQDFSESQSKLAHIDSTAEYIISYYYLEDSKNEEFTIVKKDSLFCIDSNAVNDTIIVTYKMISPFYCIYRRYSGKLKHAGKYTAFTKENKLYKRQKDGKWYFWNQSGLLERIEHWNKGELKSTFHFFKTQNE